MAPVSTPSSRRKSSSSHKKKLSKKSSEVKKKKCRSRNREKSKKPHRHRVASFSSSDDDSKTEVSLSISSSNSDFDYKRRKGRSRSRGDVKRSKKKTKRSSSIDSDSGDSSIRKKRKGSKKIDGLKAKKRSRHDKSYKKDVSVHSGCDDSSSGESDFEGSKRGRSKGREKDKKSSAKVSDGEDRYMCRSRSCSSGSVGIERDCYYVEEKLPSENNSRRLKSILAVPDAYEVGGSYQGGDENKPEIIQAYDDCPSCKSNDSVDGGRNQESSHQGRSTPDKKRQAHGEMFEDERRKDSSHRMNVDFENMDSEKVDDAFTSKMKTTQCTIDHATTMESKMMENKSEVPTDVLSSEAGDLESILRQKALENFLKFRGGHQAKSNLHYQKGESDISAKKSPSSKDGSIKSESIKEVGSRGINATEIGISDVKNVITSPKHLVQIPDGKLIESPGKNQANITRNDQKGENDITIRKPSSTLKHEPTKTGPSNEVGNKVAQVSDIETVKMKNPSTRLLEGVSVSNPLKRCIQIPISNSKRLESSDIMQSAPRPVDTKATENKVINLGAIRKPGRGSLVYIRDPSRDHSIKLASQSQTTQGNGNKLVPESSIAAVGSVKGSDPQEISKASGSDASEATSPPTPATETGNAARGGSEFETKTMSVMRGGELVQVSYKVYIPKKPPGLARRQLNRSS